MERLEKMGRGTRPPSQRLRSAPAAASAMEWSIDLEVGLRCGQSVEVLEQIGPRLRKLSIEANITIGVSKMYGLVRGEDRTFTNTIILRLADAFKSGNFQLRTCILNVFLPELRCIMKEGRNYNGVLAKNRIFDHLELLKRVKFVYDMEDVEGRVLSLYLCGCWCDLTKDCADVHHMILSSLQSAHVREVKASLFAAGCICRLSDDFASIILSALVHILCSTASLAVKISAARNFGKLRCSYIIIHRAYKAGRKLMVNFPSDEVASEMLFSLTKLAITFTVLISEQVAFLFSLVGDDCLVVKSMVLKCLLLIFSRGGCNVSSILKGFSLVELFNVTDDSRLKINSQCDGLHILWKE